MPVYLVNKHIVEVIGEAASEGVSQVSKQELLLRHSRQLVVSYGRKNNTFIWCSKAFTGWEDNLQFPLFSKMCLSFPNFNFWESRVTANLVGQLYVFNLTWSEGHVHALQKSLRRVDASLDTFRGGQVSLLQGSYVSFWQVHVVLHEERHTTVIKQRSNNLAVKSVYFLSFTSWKKTQPQTSTSSSSNRLIVLIKTPLFPSLNQLRPSVCYFIL